MNIDWPTRVITIYKTDTFMAFTGGNVYDMDTNNFRLALKAEEDGEVGMAYPDTTKHNTTVLLGGIEYARILEMINGYTITFDDTGGGWVCNLVGSNNNILDVTNLTSVQVRSNNSAGLIQTREIQYASFNGGITLDTVNGVASTVYPAGTPRQPVSNLADAMLIAGLQGFSTIYVLGDATIDNGGDYQGMTFIGESKTKTILTISDAANVLKCEFYEAHVTGTLDGDCVLKDCELEELDYIWGFIESCVLEGTVTLGGTLPAHFLDCYSGVPGVATPIIDCGGSGPPLAVRNYNGGIKLTNKSGANPVSIDLNSGQIILASTVTAGTVVVRGIGKLVDESGNHIHTGTWNGVTIVNETINVEQITESVWSYTGT